MKKINEAEKFIDFLCHTYAVYDKLSCSYELSIDDVPEHDLYELCSILMVEEPQRASEATSPDNPAYESKMLPALLNYFKHSTDKDAEIEYLHVWREGILSYHRETIKEMLDLGLDYFNKVKA